MNGILIKNFYHCMPFHDADKEGKRAIVNYYCFGPIETVTYGITSANEYYFEYTYPEFFGDAELKHDYKMITKKEMLKVINREIELCEHNGGINIAIALKNEKKLIEES
ncbi:hypothetical protein ACUH7Y_16170 [Clostridium beijerinckii]|uniref:Uncharacterized protein n=1 Tax=Clostridium beijerinckii TaxID=1520 RepID=A0A7Y9CRE7_CLOBE|nr:hypothetical protein [Clostridium beijerinckii]NMF07158.1 hypothetical protein [Clostridium beijerinckii]NOW04787.1 hypothetical protein [Clostridium beijerinckii]NYC02071.1 hypothetical protein [Clostridium beijerinckii]